jgi:hypothetical protein
VRIGSPNVQCVLQVHTHGRGVHKEQQHEPGAVRLLEYRCQRFCFSQRRGTFVPVPPIVKGFTEELMRAAVSVSTDSGPGSGISTAPVGSSRADGSWSRPYRAMQ